MSASFAVGREFLQREDIPLSVDDLKYGFERGWLRGATVIDWAVREVERGDADAVLLEVASLLREDVDTLPDVLRILDSPDHIHDPRESARKWLYLQLKAAFDRRDALGDPLAVVEQLYADFDYPPAVERLVRYMPLQPGDEPGEAALMVRWEEFLRVEHDALRAKLPGAP
jgi:hypothetical protein